jgi:hypothetical protein
MVGHTTIREIPTPWQIFLPNPISNMEESGILSLAATLKVIVLIIFKTKE